MAVVEKIYSVSTLESNAFDFDSESIGETFTSTQLQEHIVNVDEGVIIMPIDLDVGTTNVKITGANFIQYWFKKQGDNYTLTNIYSGDTDNIGDRFDFYGSMTTSTNCVAFGYRGTVSGSISCTGYSEPWEITSNEKLWIDGLHELDDMGAFANANNLTYISIPPSVKKIGRYSFRHTQLTSVRLARDCEYFPTSFPDGCTIFFYD